MGTVRVETSDAVRHLILDRPDARNALSIELCDAIVEALGGIDADPDARVVVIRGSGKVFCSGADFAAVSGPSGLDFLPAFEGMLEAVARFRLPVIARIHGAALGGGLQLATACDFRVAEEEARLGIPSSRLGIVINFENVQRLVLQVGLPMAKQVLMTARVFTGSEAATVGLVDEVVAGDSLDERVDALAEHVARLAPLSVQGAKRAIGAVGDQMLGRAGEDAGTEMARLVAEAYHSSDLQEGLAAMSEKREPRFEGS